MTLLLTERDATRLVDITAALEVVEVAFRQQGQARAVNEPRRRVHQPHGTLHLMGAALPDLGYWGFKAYTTTRQGAHFLVSLYDAASGRLLALIEANTLGQLRTGAASGVATKYCARSEASRLGLFGSGYQAETQLAAIAAVRPLTEVRVYSRSSEHRERFAETMSRRLGLNVSAVATPEEAVTGCDIVTTITSAREPLFDGSLLSPGTHVNAAGSNALVRAEVDVTTVARADRIFVDDQEQARLESGALVAAYERNHLNWQRVRELGDAVAGLIPARGGPDEITLFASHGIALWDIALAARIYERARAEGAGEEISFLDGTDAG